MSTSSYGEWPQADAKALALAVAKTNLRFDKEGRQPGAERWVDSRFHRPTMIAEVVDEWEQITGGANFGFPWHDDFVVKCWVGFRKMAVPRKVAYCNANGLAYVAKEDAESPDGGDPTLF